MCMLRLLDTSLIPLHAQRHFSAPLPLHQEVWCCQAEYNIVSAGISHNKLLAKLASGMNKPNNQTVIPVSAVPSLMGDLSLNKIRNFGGKLGQMLESLGCVTAADVQKLPREQLVRAVGDNAEYASKGQYACARISSLRHFRMCRVLAGLNVLLLYDMVAMRVLLTAGSEVQFCDEGMPRCQR